jgi:sulfide:quinone oxidoreductase
MHVVPPMGPLDVIKNSPLADQNGWLDVNKHTMQHNSYGNIFGIGDCTNVPTSKTAAACAAESVAIKRNLFKLMKGEPPSAQVSNLSCYLITCLIQV